MLAGAECFTQGGATACSPVLGGVLFHVFFASGEVVAGLRMSGGAIELGPQTGFNDQPYIEVELTDGGVGLGPYDSGWGLYPYNRILLDTGANSMLVVSDAAKELLSNGLEIEGTYHELGVAGYTEFELSAAYGLNFRGTDGVWHSLPQTLDTARPRPGDAGFAGRHPWNRRHAGDDQSGNHA